MNRTNCGPEEIKALREAADAIDRGGLWFKNGDRVRQAADTIEDLQAENDRLFSALASVEMLNQGAENAMSRWAASGEHHDAHKALRVQVDNTRKVVEAALHRD